MSPTFRVLAEPRHFYPILQEFEFLHLRRDRLLQPVDRRMFWDVDMHSEIYSRSIFSHTMLLLTDGNEMG